VQARPSVSAIVPFFNRGAVTCRALRSVLAQTYGAVELIVVNDGSTEDATQVRDLTGSQAHSIYVDLPANLGPAGARNAGLELATGDFVAFLDSDDIWAECKLEIQIGEMIRRGWKFSHTSYFRTDLRNGQKRRVRSGATSYRFPWLAFRCRIAVPTVIVERALIEGLSFRHDLRFAEDTFLWLALSKRTPLHGLDQPLSTVHVGPAAAALDLGIQAQALQLLGREGLAGYPAWQAAHGIYRGIRRTERLVRSIVRAPRT